MLSLAYFIAKHGSTRLLPGFVFKDTPRLKLARHGSGRTPCVNPTYLLSIAISLFSCSSAPQIQRIQLQWAVASATSTAAEATEIRFQNLAESLRGKSFGDLIFNEETSAVWVIPELEFLELKLAVAEEGFGEEEFDARLNRMQDVHENFLVFSVDLRLPFYPGWTQAELLDYLKKNLIVELETHSKKIYDPDRLIFRVKERFKGKSSKPSGLSSAPVEVSMPIRIYFKREDEKGPVLAAPTRQVALHLRLRTNPPFSIDFFDDKFFHGFLWKIVGR